MMFVESIIILLPVGCMIMLVRNQRTFQLQEELRIYAFDTTNDTDIKQWQDRADWIMTDNKYKRIFWDLFNWSSESLIHGRYKEEFLLYQKSKY